MSDSMDSTFCGQCDDGWIWKDNDTVDACPCSTLRQTQKLAYTKHYHQLMGRLGRIRERDLLDYKPVTDERAQQWTAFLAAKSAGEVAPDDDDVDAWLARQSVPSRSGGPDVPENPPEAGSERSERSGGLPWVAKPPPDGWDEF